MSGQVTLWNSTLESIEVQIKVNADPTGTDPEWSLVATGTGTPGTFVTGSWASTYDTSTQKATARSPLLGTGGAIELTSGVTYDVWIQTTLGDEVAVWIIGSVRCP